MRSVIARHFVLLNIFIFITVSDFLDYGIFGDAGLGDESIMDDSSDLFSSDSSSSGMVSMDPAEDDAYPEVLTSSTNDCTSRVGEMSPIGKSRRDDVCGAMEDHTDEEPFVFPSTLFDALTINAEDFCPLEKFDEGSQYLVCSSGFSYDVLNYGSGYQALLNGELGRYSLLACASSTYYPGVQRRHLSSGNDGLISHPISSVSPIVLLNCRQPRELFCCQFFTTRHLEFYELPARVGFLTHDYEKHLT